MEDLDLLIVASEDNNICKFVQLLTDFEFCRPGSLRIMKSTILSPIQRSDHFVDGDSGEVGKIPSAFDERSDSLKF